ncbi:alpha/beta hydrolase [Microbacterium foliorum]|uniref:alpha/beta hydrolase n=1 Tax=Microbacterium foliorum TaxID=104336 RepID=UPI001D312600|nr:alpha/beta hydrolase-fold protein [Microbacterium foliorum]CAH0141301.1 Endo-1,4-beta-xylanase Z [Microbacterium foliorum]CAH0187611.1 Endo-1,4-beta-xylanase Z [Microbacterium foliorum]
MDPDAPIDVPPALLQDPGADLLSTYWPAAVVLLLAAAAVALAVRAARRAGGRSRRRRALSATGWGTAGTLLLAVSLAFGVNTWVGYFPSVATFNRWVDDKVRAPVTEFPQTAVIPPSGEPSVGENAERVTTEDRGYPFLAAVPSSTKNVPDTGAWVYLPPGYDKPGNADRYPVIYALHGAPGSAADWFAGGRIDYLLDTMIGAGSIPPVIVVSPDLNAGADRVDDEPLDIPGGPQLETFVTKDVVRWADANFRTRADVDHRVVAGMSSGGLGSLLYGLHHPDLFGGVVSIMPYTSPYTAAVVADPESRKRNTPLDVIAARGTATSQKIFLGQGDGEQTTEATQIRDALRAQGQITTLRVLPHLAHNWTTARTIMPYGLVWAATQLGWEKP